MTDEFLSEEELRLMVNNDYLFNYYDLKNLYSGSNGCSDNSKFCYDCNILLNDREKYRCKLHSRKYSNEQSKKYTNRYTRKPYMAFTHEDKELLLKFK